MKWFKTLWLSSEEREILRKAKATPEVVSQPIIDMDEKPYKNVFYANNNLTVVFKDGTMLSKSNSPYALYQKVKDSITQSQIESLLIEAPVPTSTPIPSESIVDRQLVAKNLDILRDHTDFDVQGSNVSLKGVSLTMPAAVIASFIEVLEKNKKDEYHALKMFWLKLALNTLPQSREELLKFVTRNDVRITRNGNLILYRRIVTKDGADKNLVTFVTQQYYKLKKEGKDPKEYAIRRVDGEYELVDLNKYDGKGEVPFVNLQVMYLELPTYDTNTFTAAHDKSVDIRLGGIYSIPDDKINLDNGLCAAGGLHAAAVNYDYSGFGDMPVVVLVNPSKAITVPVNETGKLRTTEMFVACVNDQPIGTHFDEDSLSAFDSEYHDLTLDQLEEAASKKSFETLSVQENVPAVSLVDLKVIKDLLKTRVQLV